MDRPLEIFFSYAHNDEALMDGVRRQLIVYERKTDPKMARQDDTTRHWVARSY
jgi:hypothetical protein